MSVKYKNKFIFKYEQSRNPHANNKILHALNGGEKIIQGYSIDGYMEISVDGKLPYRIGFEYFGCRFHRCEWGCMNSVQIDTEYESEISRLKVLSLHLDELKIMRSCQWYKLRSEVVYEANLSTFLGKKNIDQDMILSAVRSGLIYFFYFET